MGNPVEIEKAVQDLAAATESSPFWARVAVEEMIKAFGHQES